MKFDITVLLDRSGSMQDRKDDHIGGLRSFVNDNKNKGDTKFTLVQFDTRNPFEKIFDGIDIDSVDTDKIGFIPRGGTPLLDSLGRTIADIENRIKGLEDETQVLLMIITDGQENSSIEWSKDKIAKAIKSKEKDWSIMYLGANVDAFDEAGKIGITPNSSMNYANTATGTQAVYSVMSNKISFMRTAYDIGMSKEAVLCSNDANFTTEDRIIAAADDKNLVNQATQ